MLAVNILVGFFLFTLMQRNWMMHVNNGISFTSLYSAVWIIVWVVHVSGLMGYDELKTVTVIYSIIPLIGSLLGELLAIKRSSGGLLIRNKEDAPRIKFDKFKYIVFIMGIISVFIGFATYYSAYQVYGTVIGSASVIKTERSFYQSDIYSNATLGPIAIYHNITTGIIFASAILSALYVRCQKKLKIWPIILPLSGATLFCFGWGSRSQIFTIVLIYVTVFFAVPMMKTNYNIFRKNWGYIAVFILILLGTVYELNLIGIATREKETIVVNGIEMPFSFVQLMDYNIGVLALFDKTLEDNDCTYGRMSFQGIEWWLKRLRILPSDLESPQQVYKWELEYPFMGENRSGNAYTWLRYLYSDFGIIGLFIIPLIISFLGTQAALNNLYRGFTLGNLSINCICSMLFVRSTVIAWTRDESFYVMIAILAVTAFLVRKVNIPVKLSLQNQTAIESKI